MQATHCNLIGAMRRPFILGGVERKIYVAHFRLCYSRKPFVVAYLRESQEMILDAFNEAFDFYGGVPRRVIIDNPKTMVTYIGKGKDRTFNPRFLALMSHYALEPVACTPRAGWRKAKLKDKWAFCVTTSLNRNPSFPHTMTSIFIYGPNARLLGPPSS